MFTLNEANALLPQLNKDLSNLQALVRQIEELGLTLRRKKSLQQHSTERKKDEEDPYFEEESKLDFMRMEADLLISNFVRKGVLLKMIDPGLIDFPAVLNGQDVLICWKQGEERITHYHGWNDGFMGRKPYPGA